MNGCNPTARRRSPTGSSAPPAQQQIGSFGQAEFGQPLFIPDAGKDEADLGT